MDVDFGGDLSGEDAAANTEPSGDFAGGDSLGTGLSLGGGNLGLNAPSDFGPSGMAGLGINAGAYGNYDFSSPGGLGLSLDSTGLGLSPEGSYGMQADFADLGMGPTADYSLAGPSTSTAALGQASTLDNIVGFLGRNRAALSALAMAVPSLAPVIGMVNLATASQSPRGAASAWGGSLGSTLGGALGGPAGAALGGMAGSALGGRSGGLEGYTGARDATAPEGEIGMNIGGIAGGLAGLYSANQAAKAYGQQASTLGDLYGQNSPYAQALRQQLERKDAAAGRRSQYGPREVELQARLAQLYSQNAPATMQAQQMAQAQRNARLNTLLGLGKATGAFDWASRGLRDVFSSPVDMTGFSTPMETPSYANFAAENYAPSNFGELGTGTYGGNDFFLNY